jgi:hypothetical protein
VATWFYLLTIGTQETFDTDPNQNTKKKVSSLEHIIKTYPVKFRDSEDPSCIQTRYIDPKYFIIFKESRSRQFDLFRSKKILTHARAGRRDSTRAVSRSRRSEASEAMRCFHPGPNTFRLIVFTLCVGRRRERAVVHVLCGHVVNSSPSCSKQTAVN